MEMDMLTCFLVREAGKGAGTELSSGLGTCGPNVSPHWKQGQKTAAQNPLRGSILPGKRDYSLPLS